MERKTRVYISGPITKDKGWDFRYKPRHTLKNGACCSVVYSFHLSSTNRTQGKILRNRSAILTVLSPIKYIFSGTKLEMIFHNTEVGFRVKTKPRLSFHLVAVPLEFEFLLIHRCRCEERSFKS